ncbi:MAG: acyl-CoA dehydratase activase [Candidatus Omnitrophota bacterium]
MYAGIDIGTTYTKCILLDPQGKVAARSIERTSVDHKGLAEYMLDHCLKERGKSKKNLAGVALTGFGRRIVNSVFSIPVTSYPDVLCICKGVWWHHKGNGIAEDEENESLLILDIGGEKWKFIHSENGNPKDFLSNDMCAVGTGKFIDYVAKSLKISIDDITARALKSQKVCEIKQTCGIFVEAEIISKLSQGQQAEDLFAGLFRHMFECIQLKSHGFKQQSEILYLIGGVSQNIFLQQLFLHEYKKVILPQEAQFIGAIGASLFLNKNQKTIGE